ncbi:MAG: hypothetical protein QOI71_3076, partial [Gaiellales bacterium]|nr:hypothetical protein [Gaiellales bacterium]
PHATMAGLTAAAVALGATIASFVVNHRRAR